MLAVRDGGAWKLVKELHVRDGGSWKQNYYSVRHNNAWTRVFSANTPPALNTQHPFWQYSMNPEFSFDDNLGLCYNTFWSTTGGGYSIPGNGNAVIRMTQSSLYTSTENKSLFCNTTNGSTNVVVKGASELNNPLRRTNVNDGSTVRWRVSGPNIPANTFVNNVVDANNITISNPATGTGNSLTLNFTRTWNAGYFARTRLQSSVALSVSPATGYQFTAQATAGTTNAFWKYSVVTAATESQANYFAGGEAQEAGGYFQTGTFSNTFVIPNGHFWMRPELTIEYNQTTPISTTRSYTFNYFNILRVQIG